MSHIEAPSLSYGDCEGPWIFTSKYRRFSSCGTALMPGTLQEAILVSEIRTTGFG